MPPETTGAAAKMGDISGMSSTYGISFVEDDAFAEGDDFALVVTPGGGWIFYRESTLCPGALEDSWSAYRELLAADSGGGPDGDDGERPTGRAKAADVLHLLAVV